MCLLYEKVVWNQPRLSKIKKTVIKYVSVLITGDHFKCYTQITVLSNCSQSMSARDVKRTCWLSNCKRSQPRSFVRVCGIFLWKKNSNHRISKKCSHALPYCHRYKWNACVVFGCYFTRVFVVFPCCLSCLVTYASLLRHKAQRKESKHIKRQGYGNQCRNKA